MIFANLIYFRWKHSAVGDFDCESVIRTLDSKVRFRFKVLLNNSADELLAHFDQANYVGSTSDRRSFGRLWDSESETRICESPMNGIRSDGESITITWSGRLPGKSSSIGAFRLSRPSHYSSSHGHPFIGHLSSVSLGCHLGPIADQTIITPAIHSFSLESDKIRQTPNSFTRCQSADRTPSILPANLIKEEPGQIVDS